MTDNADYNIYERLPDLYDQLQAEINRLKAKLEAADNLIAEYGAAIDKQRLWIQGMEKKIAERDAEIGQLREALRPDQ